MRALLGSVFAVVAASAVACPYELPTFSMTATDGKIVSSTSLGQRPAMLIFLKKGCPMNPRQIPHLNLLAEELKGTMDVYGVVDSDAAGAKAYAKEVNAAFPLLPDEKKLLIGAVKAKNSLNFLVVATKNAARYAKVWKGVSTPNLKEALDIVVRHGQSIATPSLKGFTDREVSGCSF
jgi:peroxiredoxin